MIVGENQDQHGLIVRDFSFEDSTKISHRSNGLIMRYLNWKNDAQRNGFTTKLLNKFLKKIKLFHLFRI